MTFKSVSIALITLCLGIGTSFYSRKLPAQTAFHGARITYSDFYACDPATSRCTSQMNYVETVSADLATRSTVWSKPGTIGEDFAVIDTATEYIQVYPEVKEYFRMKRTYPRPNTAADPNPDCAASSGAKSVLVGHSGTLGYATADYRTDTPQATVTASYARDLGCLAIRTVFLWKGATPESTSRPTYHVATEIQTAFDRPSLDIPPDTAEVSPLQLRHDVYVRRGSSSVPGSKEAAEADWQARLKDGRLSSLVAQNEKWLAAKGQSGQVVP
jgi:hypothetical protein